MPPAPVHLCTSVPGAAALTVTTNACSALPTLLEAVTVTVALPAASPHTVTDEPLTCTLAVPEALETAA